MSFIAHEPLRNGYQPGWFLASAVCTRETVQVSAEHAQARTAPNGGKYVPAGAVITGKGLLYEDVDVSTGDMPGSCVTAGRVYADRLPSDTSLEGLSGIINVGNAPKIERPDFSGKTEEEDTDNSSKENSEE